MKKLQDNLVANNKEANIINPQTTHISPHQPYTPLLVIALIISSFFLGSLYTKVQYLEKNKSTVLAANATITPIPNKPGPLHVAKAIGLKEEDFKTCLESGKYSKNVAEDLSDGQRTGVNSTPTTFVNGQIVVGAQPSYASFKTLIDQELASPNHPLTAGSRMDVSLGSLPALGDANALVTVVEFGDFQCPFCERFYTQTEKALLQDYVNSGKVRFVFRNFAFLGPDSDTAAQGAYCANEQGKFWQYHNFLYEHQGPENSGTFSKESLE